MTRIKADKKKLSVSGFVCQNLKVEIVRCEKKMVSVKRENKMETDKFAIW